ncbi:GTPase Era [Thiorhodospira sibirica]|uniref:GTPase Era n=1 Tax=Thiorhodospira sibirica TaxID=154347 RepID=UPI00022C11C9|nr:GTPase Era [Thiorhodospira sibirica]
MTASTPATRCGYIAIIGRPNVGKSTLLNGFVGEKIAAASRKPQTTRHTILGIVTRPNHDQLIFVDTPGIDLGNRHRLGQVLNRTAQATLNDVDVILLVVEAGRFDDADQHILQQAIGSRRPILLAINKVDRISDKRTLLPYIERLSQRHEFADIVPLSGLKGINLEPVLEALSTLLPANPPLFDEDAITDRSERFRASEIIREQLLERLGQEVPYNTHVEVEAYQDSDNGGVLEIHATIFVTRTSQKGILVGKGGHMIKAIGTGSRKALEELLGRKIMLKLRVAADPNWQDKHLLRQ